MDKREEKRSLKSLEKICTVMVILLLLVITVAFWIIPDNANSEKEKRSLAQAPVPKVESLLSGEFMEDIESYFKDQFPLRDTIMQLKTDVMTGIGKISSQGVYLTNDGSLVESFTNPEAQKTQNDIKAVNDFAKKYSESNVSVLLAPTAVSVNKEKLKEVTITDNQDAYIDQFFSALDTSINRIDIRTCFEKKG